MKLAIKIDGLQQIIRRLDNVDSNLRKSILRDAVRQAGVVIRQAEKRAAPVSTDDRLVPGLLRLAIDVKVKVFRRSGTAVAIVGPRTNFARDKKTKKRKLTGFGKSAGKRLEKWWLKKLAKNKPVDLSRARKQAPSYYAHLAGPGRRQQFATATKQDAAGYARSVMIGAILQGIEEAAKG